MQSTIDVDMATEILKFQKTVQHFFCTAICPRDPMHCNVVPSLVFLNGSICPERSFHDASAEVVRSPGLDYSLI